MHVNESNLFSVRACAFESKIAGMVRSDFDSNRRLVNENEKGMVPIGSDLFRLMVRTEGIWYVQRK